MFIKKLQNFIFHEKLFSRGDKIIIGVSGGPDSTCLAMLLDELKDKYDSEIFLIHVNYGLRGDDSEKDEEFVREFAKKKGLGLKVVKFSGNPESVLGASQKKRNSEERMRDFRYSIFENERKKKGFDWIAVGHNTDDQVETFFLNLFRGAGIAGLGGMKAKRGKIIRPLLNFSKKEILDFLEERDQDFRIDESNLRLEFSRNKIRQELIPFIEKEYSSQLKTRVANLIENLQDAIEIVQYKTKEEYEKVVTEDSGKITIDVEKFLSLDSSLQGFVFRRAIKELKGDLKNISKSNFFEFMKIAKSEKGKSQKMKIGEVRIERNGGKIFLKNI